MIPEDYLARTEIFARYAHNLHDRSGRFHAAGIRKAIESDTAKMKQSDQILLEKDIARWMRCNAGIEFIGVEGRTHYYAFKEAKK